MSYFVTTITYANNETSAMILKRCCPSVWESLAEHFQTNTGKKIIHMEQSRELPIFPEVDIPASSIKPWTPPELMWGLMFFQNYII